MDSKMNIPAKWVNKLKEKNRLMTSAKCNRREKIKENIWIWTEINFGGWKKDERYLIERMPNMRNQKKHKHIYIYYDEF